MIIYFKNFWLKKEKHTDYEINNKKLNHNERIINVINEKFFFFFLEFYNFLLIFAKVYNLKNALLAIQFLKFFKE